MRHPRCRAGHHKLPVEVLLVRCWPVIVVKEDWLNFDWDLLGTLCFMAAQMDSFVAATATAHCKLDITGGRFFTGNQVAESTLNVQESMALAKLTSVFQLDGSVCKRSLHTVGTPTVALCSHAGQ